MFGVEAAFLGGILLLAGTAEAPAITPGEFQAWYEAATRGTLRIPRTVLHRAKGFRYVFLGGFRSERMAGYFARNARELRAQGVPRRAIHFVYPGSGRTVEENGEAVREALFEIAARGPERLVLIGHSRGACDALAFALHEPGFVAERVEALFLVQGPFGGSALADYVLGEGEAIDKRLGPAHRLIARTIGRLELGLFAKGKHAGLAGMTRAASRAYWRKELGEHAGAIPVVGPRAFYVESTAAPSRLRLFQRTMARYLGTYYGPNDGVVALGDQVLPGLGTSLGTLDAGHADFTRGRPANRVGKTPGRALMRAILMAVGKPEGIRR